MGRANTEVILPAVCINAERPIPTENDLFDRLSSAAVTLAKFLDSSQHLMPAAVQAGVWAITDQYDRTKITAKLKTQNGHEAEIWGEFSTRPSIFESDVAEAREVLSLIGIKTNL
jgi:hypothetical protein